MPFIIGGIILVCIILVYIVSKTLPTSTSNASQPIAKPKKKFYRKRKTYQKKETESAEELGKEGEKIVRAELMKSRACHTGKSYIISDIILLDEHEKTSQIDHIFINEFGVWVIETKNLSGMIYGDETQKNWTQVLAYGKEKHSLYNPVKQNYTHLYKLKDLIGEEAVFHSLVVFVKADIQNVQARGVCTLEDLCAKIWEDTGIHLTDDQIEEYYQKIGDLMDQNDITTEDHVKNIKQRREDLQGGTVCPRCGGKQVLRVTKNGSFYGCSNYPKCTYTRKSK